MLGFGHWWILLIVLAIVLIVYGPGKLPEVGGAIGKGIREFRKASSDLQDELKKGVAGEPPLDTRSTTDVTAPTDKTPTDKTS